MSKSFGSTDIEAEKIINERVNNWCSVRTRFIDAISVVNQSGMVKEVVGTLVEGHLSGAKIGDLCELYNEGSSEEGILAEVVGFTNENVLLSALGSLEGVSDRTKIKALNSIHKIRVTKNLFGQVLDGFGRSMSGSQEGAFSVDRLGGLDTTAMPVISEALDATEKPRIQKRLPTGVRVIDSLLTMGEASALACLPVRAAAKPRC